MYSQAEVDHLYKKEVMGPLDFVIHVEYKRQEKTEACGGTRTREMGDEASKEGIKKQEGDRLKKNRLGLLLYN